MLLVYKLNFFCFNSRFVISGAKLDFFHKTCKKSNKKTSFYKKKFQIYYKTTIFVEKLQQGNTPYYKKIAF